MGHIRVPDHTSVLNADLLEGVVNLFKLLDSLVQRLLGPAHTSQLAQRYLK